MKKGAILFLAFVLLGLTQCTKEDNSNDNNNNEQDQTTQLVGTYLCTTDQYIDSIVISKINNQKIYVLEYSYYYYYSIPNTYTANTTSATAFLYNAGTYHSDEEWYGVVNSGSGAFNTATNQLTSTISFTRYNTSDNSVDYSGTETDVYTKIR